MPTQLKEKPSKQLKLEFAHQNEVVTNAADILIGKTAKISMNSNMGGKNIKLAIQNDESGVMHKYVDAPETAMAEFNKTRKPSLPLSVGTTQNSLTSFLAATSTSKPGTVRQGTTTSATTSAGATTPMTTLQVITSTISSITSRLSTSLVPSPIDNVTENKTSVTNTMSISKFEITTKNSAVLREVFCKILNFVFAVNWNINF